MNMHSEREDKDKKLFDEIGKDYIQKDLYPPSIIARKHRLIRTLEGADIRHCSSILELGCGGGFTAKYLEGFFSSYIGVDYSETLIDYARVHSDESNVDYIVDNVKSFNPKGQFDVIIMIGVLHHIDGVDNTLQKILLWLNPGGLLITNEPHRSNLLITIARKIRKYLDKNYSSDQVEFKANELKKLYMDAGFTGIKVVPQGFLSTIFAEVMIGPQIITTRISELCCRLDKIIERLPAKLILPFSWNVITVGRKSVD